MKGAFQGIDKKAPPVKKDEKPGSGVALPQWSKKKFIRAPELKDAPVAGTQMDRLAAWFHKHPYRSFSALALILLIIVLDVALLFGRFSAVEWVAVNFVPHSPMGRLFKGGGENVFLTASDPLPGLGVLAVPRSTEALYGIWEPVKTSPLEGGEVKGILDKKEARELKLKGLKDVTPSGVQSFMGQGKTPENLSRTILLAKSPGAASPYGPAYDGAQSSGAVNIARIDPKLAKKGESFNRIIPESEFAGVAPEEEEEQAPEGEVGEDVLAELQKMNPEKVSRFAQKHGWQLNKHDSDPEMPELPKNGLGKSWAAWQLLETMRLNDKASSCTTCAPETRINKGRAEFFGEKR
ncbi:MAG TPA: hypothetical protein DCM05_00730 [Elusimicrobia bacterium]|nr:hypothetical protein [Elusimicrobiota bacterium]